MCVIPAIPFVGLHFFFYLFHYIMIDTTDYYQLLCFILSCKVISLVLFYLFSGSLISSVAHIVVCCVCAGADFVLCGERTDPLSHGHRNVHQLHITCTLLASHAMLIVLLLLFTILCRLNFSSLIQGYSTCAESDDNTNVFGMLIYFDNWAIPFQAIPCPQSCCSYCSYLLLISCSGGRW